ncbi:MAG: amidase [Armatimonadetes bacterium]|nr:amidase [Armatimonadota bacterium]
MKRRDFLNAGLATGVSAMAGNLLANENVHPYSVPDFDLEEKTTADLQKAMKEGSETSASITQQYLERIHAVDQSGPKTNSVIELNPDAMEIAQRLDEERSAGKVRGPLHGIPILIKDNIETGDKMMTTAGSLVLDGNVAKEDAFIVKRMVAAGAIILGKTNLSEWANFRSTHSTSGWSGRGGQTKNPYALDRNPCGSSSGSGVAASANFCAIAVGTETDGSIVCPSTNNGLVGVKPTVGLVSRTGIIPLSHSQDTAGPMARTVTDAALLLGVLAGKDPSESASKGYKGASDYLKFLKPGALKGARIGIARKFFGFNDKVDYIMHEAILVLKELGAVMVDPADLPSHGKYDDTELEVLLYDFKHDIEAYLRARNLKAKTLADLIKMNDEMKDREMPFFGQEIFHQAQAKGPLTDKKYIKALERNHRLSRDEGIDGIMDKLKLDAIIAPTGGPAWTTDLLNGDHFTGGSSTPSAVAGYPAVTLPAGNVRGLPVGITFFGRAWSEGKLLSYAYAFERATGHRKAPKFLETAIR